MKTIWLLVHQSTTAEDEIATSKSIGFFRSRAEAESAIRRLCRFDGYRRDQVGFRMYELSVDERIDRTLSDDIVFGIGRPGPR
jgi:hypothetical protein